LNVTKVQSIYVLEVVFEINVPNSWRGWMGKTTQNPLGVILFVRQVFYRSG
jgi:hypothetical protein